MTVTDENLSDDDFNVDDLVEKKRKEIDVYLISNMYV